MILPPASATVKSPVESISPDQGDSPDAIIQECAVVHEPGGLAVVSVRADETRYPDLAELRCAIALANDDPRCWWVVFDFSAVDYVDSSTLSALIACKKSFDNREGAVIISGAGPYILRSFEITRLCELFAIAGSVEDARNEIARLRRKSPQTNHTQADYQTQTDRRN